MPRAYLIALCSGSSVDRDLGNVSLFNLVEQVTIPELAPGTRLQLEVHSYWEAAPGEVGQDFDCRFVLTQGGRLSGEPSPIVRFCLNAERVHARAVGLPVPALGPHHLGIEWRRRGEERWIREPAQWPIAFHAAPPER